MRPSTQASDSFEAINIEKLLWKELPSTFHRANFFDDIAKKGTLTPYIEGIKTFSLDPTLGVGSNVIILVKRVDQLTKDSAIVSNLGSGRSNRRGSKELHSYYPGYVLKVQLSDSEICLNSSQAIFKALQPTGIDYYQGDVLIASGSEILILNAKTLELRQKITDSSFAKLHTVEVNESKRTILTVSSSLDTIVELDLDTQEKLWEFCAWNNGFDTNSNGERFTRKPVKNSKKIFVSDRYNNGLGLPTYVAPVHLNGASYLTADSFLCTAFHQGEAWIISQHDALITPVMKGLGCPHGFIKNNQFGGTLLSNTESEEIIFLDCNFHPIYKLSLGGFAEKLPGLTSNNWLQLSGKLSADTYFAVMEPYRKILVFNLFERTYNAFSYDRNWGIQTLYPLNSKEHG